jgi:hypothetical protein
MGDVTTRPWSATLFQERVEHEIEGLIASCPDPAQLSAEERRGIIARYAAVLEGNFIYWMTAAYLSVASVEAHAIIRDNLCEEVRDNHPGMLRRFALAAQALPTDSDALAVSPELESVRRFVAELSGVKIVLMMTFFEGFISRFMPYLAELAARQGSAEQRYTSVHGVVDVEHTQGLFRAADAEMTLVHDDRPPAEELLEGLEVLRGLIQSILRLGDPGRPHSW